MNKSHDEMKSDLSKVSAILLACNEKAIVLKACNDMAAQMEGLEGSVQTGDIGLFYCGMSRITYEIVEQISEVQNLIGKMEGRIESLQVN